MPVKKPYFEAARFAFFCRHATQYRPERPVSSDPTQKIIRFTLSKQYESATFKKFSQNRTGVSNYKNRKSNLDHFKIILARTAFRAGPADRHILPAGSGGNAIVGPARCFVVNQSAYETHPGFIVCYGQNEFSPYLILIRAQHPASRYRHAIGRHIACGSQTPRAATIPADGKEPYLRKPSRGKTSPG